MISLEGRVALVTGGSRGIGRMIATGLLHQGATVYISARKAAACEAAAGELSRHGRCHALPADISRMEDIARIGETLGAREGALDILVNNAGATWGAPLGQFPEQGWDKVMDLNVKGMFFLTQTLLPLLEKRASAADPARVINIGSVDGMHTPAFDNFSYSPSKAAVHQMTRMLAAHLARRHVTVNAIAPGPFATDMMAPMAATMGDEILARVPLGRMGEAADIGGVAIMLAARAGAYLTGAVIPVDGGLFAGS